jgi:lysozyme family protein
MGSRSGPTRPLHIESLTLADAKRIYHRDFWAFVSGDALPWPLSYFVFDAAVNQGVAPAIRHAYNKRSGSKPMG